MEAFHRTVRTYPHKKLYIHLPDGKLKQSSYAELAIDVHRLSCGLRRLGLKAGDTVLIQVERIDDFIALFWASVISGMLPAPMKPAWHQKPDHADHQKLVRVWEWLDRPLIVTDRHVEPASSSVVHNPLSAANIVSVRDLFANDVLLESEPHPAAPEDGALYLVTSGTTGMPKCVRYCHSHVVSTYWASNACSG